MNNDVTRDIKGSIISKDEVINILIIDDDYFNRLLVRSLIDKLSNITLYEAKEGQEGLDILDKESIDVVLLDLHMPGINGYTFLEAIKHKSRYENLIIIVITTDIDEKENILAMGADDLVPKPFKLEVLQPKILDNLHKKRKKLKIHTTKKEKFKYDKNKTYKLEEIEAEQRKHFYKLMALRFASAPTKYIQRQLSAHIAKDMAKRYGFDDNHTKNIHCSVVIIDIGLIALPEVINHNKKITTKVKKRINGYIFQGHKLFSDKIESDFTHTAQSIIQEYKERFDGKGIPKGLRGDEISTEAYIVSIADLFEALLHTREYRDKQFYTPNEAYDIFVAERGKKFDPKILDLFLQKYDSYMELRKIYIQKAKQKFNNLI